MKTANKLQIACVLALLLLSACPSTKVTFQDKTITDPTLRSFIIALNVADKTFAAATRFLVDADMAGLLPDKLLASYSATIAVPFVNAMKDARIAIMIAVKSDNQSNTSQIHSNLIAVEELLKLAVSIARRNGW